MLDNLKAFFGQRTTIQGVSVLAASIVAVKMQIITATIATPFVTFALGMIGLQETSAPVKTTEPVKIEQPVITDVGVARQEAGIPVAGQEATNQDRRAS